MTPEAKKRMIKWAGALFVVYLLGGAVLYFIQDLLLFHPSPLSREYKYKISQPFTEHNLLQENGTNLALIKFPTEARRGIVLYFHGNMKNVERYAPYAALFTRKGYELWMMDYRGFGKSTGKLNEQVLYDDALQVYQLAIAEVSADKIIIYGKSLGTGVASQLASNQKCKKLILETPYYAIPHIAKDKIPIYPVDWLIKYRMPTHQFLRRVTVPVTVFHGTNDEVISYNQALKLKKENKTLELVTVNAGRHNNLLQYHLVQQKLQQLLD